MSDPLVPFALCSCVLAPCRVSRVVRKLVGKVSHEKVCVWHGNISYVSVLTLVL